MAVSELVIAAAELESVAWEVLLGTVLPDYNPDRDHHYIRRVPKGQIFCLTEFRDKYQQRLRKPVYLGYYLHLVQDVAFRDLLYNKYGFSPSDKERVRKLYSDYSALNGYLMDKYDIRLELLKDEEFLSSDTGGFVLNREELATETELYHRRRDVPGYEYSFFTPAMADEYVESARQLCLQEIEALAGRAGHIDEERYAFNI